MFKLCLLRLQKKSVMRLKGMKLMTEARQRAAIAAALAGRISYHMKQTNDKRRASFW